MIKLIVKYMVQEWCGNGYQYKKLSKIITFNTFEEVTNENIEKIHNGWVEILDIKQIIDTPKINLGDIRN